MLDFGMADVVFHAKAMYATCRCPDWMDLCQSASGKSLNVDRDRDRLCVEGSWKESHLDLESGRHGIGVLKFTSKQYFS